MLISTAHQTAAVAKFCIFLHFDNTVTQEPLHIAW